MGTISFHIHGELAKNASIDSNVVVYISSVLYNNPATEDAISAMRTIFAQEVAVPFANDWLTRTVQSGYLSGSVLCPPSSPVKATRSRHERPTSVNTPSHITRSASPTTSSISSVSSLTMSALAAHEIMSNRSSQSTQSFPKPQAARSTTRSTTGRSTTIKATQPLPSATKPPVMESSPALARTANSAGPLSEDVKEFMASIGKNSASDHDVIREIFNFTGRALWETTLAVRLKLNSGTAKALVGLMLNIT